MGGQQRYCVQCGSELSPSTRFCGNCGHATTTAGTSVTEPDMRRPPAPEQAEAASDTWPGSRPPVPPAPRSGGTVWRDADAAGSTPGPAAPNYPAPPTGPAYPPPQLPSAAEPEPPAPAPPVLPSPALPPAEPGPPLTGPAYRPTATAPVYAATERPTPPPPDRPLPPPPGRAGSGPRPSYPPPPAQYALPAAAPAPTSPPPPGPPAPGATEKFGTSWMDQVGFNPQWEQAPAKSRWGRTSTARPAITDVGGADGPARPRRGLVAGLFVLLAAVLVVPAFLIVHAFHGLGSSSAAATQPTAKPARSASAAPTGKSAATALGALLAQSVTDRDTIVSAVGAVNHCTSAVGQAPAQFQEGATSRQRLLKQLASMPGRTLLPATMVRELTTAWQASATVDEDLSKWAQDEVSSSCHTHNDANLAAADGPDGTASSAKSAFVSQWNPLAARYGLTRYSTGQL